MRRHPGAAGVLAFDLDGGMGDAETLGQHSAETLAKGGLSDDEIAKLRDAGVILQRE